MVAKWDWMRRWSVLFFATFCVSFSGEHLCCEETVVAVLNFDVDGVKELDPQAGALLAELVSGELSRKDDVRVVERGYLRAVLEEQSLNLSDLTDDRALQFGHLIGAELLITGRAFSIEKRLIVTAKLIRTDDATAVAVVAQEDNESPLPGVSKALAGKIYGVLLEESSADNDRQASVDFNEAAEGCDGDRRRVVVSIRPGQLGTKADSKMAEDQLRYRLETRGFEVVAWAQKRSALEKTALPEDLGRIDGVLLGAVSSEVGLRTGDVISAKAWVEITVSDSRSGQEPAKHSLESRGLGVTAKEATENAIRKAIDDSVESLVSQLLKER
jgi:TolB-like protein